MGSAHCTLIPYWAERSGRTTLRAPQVSPRGGELSSEHHGDHVRIGGHAVSYSIGFLHASWPQPPRLTFHPEATSTNPGTREPALSRRQ